MSADIVDVGIVTVTCPECDVDLPIPVTALLEPNADNGRQHLVCDPDMTDVWAHYFIHGGTG